MVATFGTLNMPTRKDMAHETDEDFDAIEGSADLDLDSLDLDDLDPVVTGSTEDTLPQYAFAADDSEDDDSDDDDDDDDDAEEDPEDDDEEEDPEDDSDANTKNKGKGKAMTTAAEITALSWIEASLAPGILDVALSDEPTNTKKRAASSLRKMGYDGASSFVSSLSSEEWVLYAGFATEIATDGKEIAARIRENDDEAASLTERLRNAGYEKDADTMEAEYREERNAEIAAFDTELGCPDWLTARVASFIAEHPELISTVATAEDDGNEIEAGVVESETEVDDDTERTAGKLDIADPADEILANLIHTLVENSRTGKAAEIACGTKDDDAKAAMQIVANHVDSGDMKDAVKALSDIRTAYYADPSQKPTHLDPNAPAGNRTQTGRGGYPPDAGTSYGGENAEGEKTVVALLADVKDFGDITVEDVLMTLHASASEHPFWNVLIQGEPIAQVHLQDQQNPQVVASIFGSAEHYAEGIRDNIVSYGLKETLNHLNARLFAAAYQEGAAYQKAREEIIAEAEKFAAEQADAHAADMMSLMLLAHTAFERNMVRADNPMKAAVFIAAKDAGVHDPGALAETAIAMHLTADADDAEAAPMSAMSMYLTALWEKAKEYREMEPTALEQIAAHIMDTPVSVPTRTADADINNPNQTLRERLAQPTNVPVLSGDGMGGNDASVRTAGSYDELARTLAIGRYSRR